MEVLTMVSAAVAGQLKSLFEGVAKELGEEVKHVLNNKILEYQVEEYNRNFCTKTLLHRVQPKNLKDFYQPLFIIPCGKDGRHSFQENSKRIPTDSIKNLFKNRQFITLVGNAGSGKSTIVKYLFLNAIDTNYKTPIKVELRYLNEYNGSIIDFIKDKILKLSRISTHDKITERLLSSGDFVFFLDGYDEINSSKKEKITKEIDDLVKVYNKNHYLLTSRPYTDIDLLPMFHNFQVCTLSDKEINQFISKQLPPEEKELCDKIIEAVNSPENNSYKTFLSNPLLLSMFILTFQSYSNIPEKRNEFYSQVFDALFSVHDSMSKLAFVREKQSGLSKEQFIDVLKLFSFMSYFDEKFVFSGIYLTKKLATIKEKKQNLKFDNEKLINDLQVAIGILNKEGTDFTFPHRSLQEYFAALYISTLNEANKSIVYSKILKTLTQKVRHANISRDNFYLLLSELDEKSVIKIALIPFLDDFIKNYKTNEEDHNTIIESFLTLQAIYDSFAYIIKDNSLSNFNGHLSSRFHAYLEDVRRENKSTHKSSKRREDDFLIANKQLAHNDIKPFLDTFISSAKLKRNELEQYHIAENMSDTEIISLI